jgi:hypothetical protein
MSLDDLLVVLLLCAPGIALMAWLEVRRERRRRHEQMLRDLDRAFRRAKRLDDRSRTD